MPGRDDEIRMRAELFERQRERLARMLGEVLPRNRFYAEKFHRAGLERVAVRTMADLRRLPLTTKAELLVEQVEHPPYGRLLTYSRERYIRLHQTSGSKGVPLRWLDTPESWTWTLDCWARMLAMIGVTATDRLLFAFSFGPFLGFWTAFEAAARLGCLCLTAGGMSSGARLRMLLDNQATIVLCTPTYALHLAQVAREQGIRLEAGTPGYAVRALVVAGEPGGSIPATRRRLEEAWHARVFDHSGMTEIGPLAIECEPGPGGLHVMEEDYLAEVVDPVTLEPTTMGALGELVLTNLGRWGSPLIRYRTGDLVRVDPRPCPCGSALLRLDGGILGRTDDMVPIRGNNFYPSALEGVLRRFAEIVEYRVEVDSSAALAELRIEIEPRPDADPLLAERIVATIRDELLFRAEVHLAVPGSLPRFEMKAQRVRNVADVTASREL
jgi:phenylacetate-CoA ligase